MTTGSRIKELRIGHGYLQADFAKMIGCSKQVVSNIERGVTDVSADMAVRIADVFQVKIEDVVSDVSKDSFILSGKEKSIIGKYRRLAPADQELLTGMLDMLSTRTK